MNRKSRLLTHLGKILIFSALCTLSGAVSAADATVTVDGKTLKLIGSGLREFLFIDIYRMSAYSESGDCTPSKIVYKNETKTLRLAILRELPAERMRSTLRETLVDALPKDKDNTALMGKIESFLAVINKDLPVNTYVELTYIPGRGTIVKRDGKILGTTPGKDFADLLWKSYFGGDTCCASLKSAILKECKKQ